jgi:hypothetical protein
MSAPPGPAPSPYEGALSLSRGMGEAALIPFTGLIWAMLEVFADSFLAYERSFTSLADEPMNHGRRSAASAFFNSLLIRSWCLLKGRFIRGYGSCVDSVTAVCNLNGDPCESNSGAV